MIVTTYMKYKQNTTEIHKFQGQLYKQDYMAITANTNLLPLEVLHGALFFELFKWPLNCTFAETVLTLQT